MSRQLDHTGIIVIQRDNGGESTLMEQAFQSEVEEKMNHDEKPLPDDWRRQGQEKYLTGSKLIKRPYFPYREGWEHDHCEFCGDKFSLSESDLSDGYSTDNGYHWICEECFADFKDEFAWQVADESVDP